MKKYVRYLLLAGLCAQVCDAGAPAAADGFAALREEVLQLGELKAPPAVYDASADAATESTAAMQAVYFEGLPYRGSSTRAFAWLGLPQKRNGKVPGVVLVHGGGGTAFKEWVKLWNDRGFAAISIAVEGQTDVKDSAAVDPGRAYKRHQWAGPARNGIYGDSAEPLQDQWMYHAVAQTISANSLLRSLPEVDASRVGLSGISWGGVITSTVMGIDDRFAFAIPVYGCGEMQCADNQWGVALEANQMYQNVWNPGLYLSRAQMPALWLSWPGDMHFPLDSLAASYGAMKGDFMTALIPGMKHSHPAGWTPKESYAFAESIVQEGTPWCRQVGEKIMGNNIDVVFESSRPLDRAVLISTVDSGFTGKRNWVETPAELTRRDGRWVASAEIPGGTTACFINAKSDALTVSSLYKEL
jgi:cephalosporin-C deacetylase-like acetyl esterase